MRNNGEIVFDAVKRRTCVSKFTSDQWSKDEEIIHITVILVLWVFINFLGVEYAQLINAR